MTLRHHVMKDRPSKINVSEWVDSERAVSEAQAHADLMQALRDTGDCLTYSRERDIDDNLVYYITWKPGKPKGKRLMRVNTNLED